MFDSLEAIIFFGGIGLILLALVLAGAGVHL